MNTLLRGILLFLVSIYSLPAYANNQAILIIDTHEHTNYRVHTLQTLLKTAGFSPSYCSLYMLSQEDLTTYQAILLLLDTQFLEHGQHPIIQQLCTQLSQFAQEPQKVVGIFMPSGNTPGNVYNLFIQFLDTLSPTLWHTITTSSDLLVQTVQLLATPDIYYSWCYDTALLAQRSPYQKLTERAYALLQLRGAQGEKVYSKILPSCTIYHNHSFFPFALIVEHPYTHTYFLLSRQSFFTHSEIQEDFWLHPLDTYLQQEFLTTALHILHELYYIGAQKTLCPVVPEAPRVLESTPTIKQNTQPPIFCGWLELDPMVSSAQNVQVGMEALYKAGLTMLWLQARPELYLSSHAQWANKQEEFFTQLAQFTSGLQHYKPAQTTVPDLFIGIELTGNFSTTPVPICAQDIYGVSYTKIPAPLDREHFWQPEVFAVLDTFIKRWPEISNDIPIGGIMFDFEMYHAQDQTTLYTSYMDFSDHSWQLYIHYTKQAELNQLATVQERVLYLYQHKLLDAYFAILQKRSMQSW